MVFLYMLTKQRFITPLVSEILTRIARNCDNHLLEVL